MTLKKTIAGYRDSKGDWVNQCDIEMHPFEEAAIQAHWAHGELTSKLPSRPTMQEEHEWLIQYGADFVKQRRSDLADNYNKAQPAILAALKTHLDLHEIWNNHVESCIAQGLDPETHLRDTK